MANEPIITVVGNLAADPEARETPNGNLAVNFRVGQTPRVKNGDQWVDGETTWFSCTAWNKLGENCLATLTKGTRVLVQGAMSTRSYEKDGEQRSALNLRVEHIGPELSWATAIVERNPRNDANSSSNGFANAGRGNVYASGGSGFSAQNSGQSAGQQGDVWSRAEQASQQSFGMDDETIPF